MDISEIPTTFKQLVELIKLRYPKEIKELQPQTPEQIALWFCCCHEARAMYEFRVKDIAAIFRDGIAPMKERVDEFVTTFWADFLDDNGKLMNLTDEEDLEALKEVYDNLIKALNYHFGIKDE